MLPLEPKKPETELAKIQAGDQPPHGKSGGQDSAQKTIKLSKFPFLKSHKYVFLVALILTLTFISYGSFVLISHILNSTPDANTSDNEEMTPREKASRVSGEAYDIASSESAQSYIEAIQHFDDAIAASDSEDLEFELRIAKANFLNNNGGPHIALSDLLTINEEGFSDRQKYALFSAIRFSYVQIGDETKVSQYENKISKLPKEVTVVGEF